MIRMTPAEYDSAACASAGPVLFYDPANSAEARETIRLFCTPCPVREACLRYALSVPKRDDWGIAGGTTVHQRRRIRRAQEAPEKDEAAA